MSAPLFKSERLATIACFADLDAQRKSYARAREATASGDGCFDNTPENGPMPVPIVFSIGAEWGFRVFWGIHKHPWPLDYWYCFGRASESRGERTDPLCQFDIRDLPKKYIGRFNISRRSGCGRRSHRTIIARALSDGFDIAGHALAVEERWASDRRGLDGSNPFADISDLEVPF